MSESQVSALDADHESTVDADDAVAVARRALQQAALANPALAGLERLLDEFVDAALSPEAAAFLRLLDGADDIDVTRLGMPLAGARLVVVRPGEPGHLPILVTALRDERQALSVIRGGCLNVLVRNVPRRAGEDKGLRTAKQVATVATRVQPTVHVGISAALTPDVDLAAAARDAADAADLAARRGCRVLCVDDVWGELVATRLRNVLPAYLTTDHPLSRLVEHDQRQRSDPVATVGAWLAQRCDTADTARLLSLHPNSLRYRLRRAQEVSGLDLSDPTQALVAQLLCRGSS